MNWNLVVIGFVVHLIFFYSIFDIYFTSPLVHGMMPHSNNMTAPAKRLVLFVADGLRADKLFEVDAHGGTHTPYLRHKIEHDGAWGISHTRVPTESRPGHVALIAGFYEDVSAVAKGWKENPVEFDSVFNESRFTWSWGSPDILPMFSKGASGNHVFIHTYPGHSEDFAEGDMTKLDTWVFEKVKTFFKKAANDADLREKLAQDRLVFFLHLLGLDTSGHVHKPFSHEYVQNLKVVDGGVREIVDLFEDFYSNDGQTAYVFTADHGMTNWGSHGAGHPSETLTPLVAWGSGVRSSIKSDNQHPDGYHNDWNLVDVKRSDVNQADISPFMATLIGAAIPLQSVGTVPIDYLDASDEFKARSLLTNAKQILEQFQIKKKLKEDTTLSLLFKPYRSLISSVQEEKIHLIEGLLMDGKFEEAIFHSQSLIELGLEGLTYYHNYDRLFLGTSIALGFLGWMAYIGTLILQDHTNIVQHYNHISSVSHGNNKIVRLVFVAIGVLAVLFLYVQSLRWTYYIYLLLPLFLWNQVGQRLHILRMTCWYIVDYRLLFKAITFGFFGFLGLELIILSFTYRQLLSLGLVGMALYSRAASNQQTDKTVLGGWIASCCVVAIFPLLPTIGKVSDYNLVYLSGISSVVLTLFVLARFLHQPKQSQSHYAHHHDLILPFPVKPLAYVQVLLVFLSTCNVWYNVSNRHGKTNVSNSTHLFSWGMLISSFILPMTSSSRLLPRLITIALAFLSPFLLLSISHEGFFYISLCSLMFFWLQLESKLSLRKLELLDFVEAVKLGSMPRHLTFSDTRCAYFFIYFLLTAFFGTGNIASINSFDPTSVLCFLSIFNPFVMGALMLWKILIPFLVVTCTFNAIHLSVNVPTQSLFLLVLLMSDFMALHFFFFVRDYGSWLEIGTSISHYVVVMSIILFLFVLLSVSKIFTEVTLRLPHKCGSKCHKQ